jgi:hypothetical protein
MTNFSLLPPNPGVSTSSQEFPKNPLRIAKEAENVTYSYFDQLPRLEDIEPLAHSDVLIAESRLDQGRTRAAVDAVFAAHPTLGAVFETRFGDLTFHLGGAWSWAVEPPGVGVGDVIARQRASFDMHTGRMFAVSLIPGVSGAPERLVLTASRLCVDKQSWQDVVAELVGEYGGELVVQPTQRRSKRRFSRGFGACSR